MSRDGDGGYALWHRCGSVSLILVRDHTLVSSTVALVLRRYREPGRELDTGAKTTFTAKS